ncbi:MAG: sialate O-acetylesterase [Cytophagales bacterium]|nr:sialate O-acetylesterase [Cytophagales bacterium]
MRLIIILLISLSHAMANVVLPVIYSNNMVLQRDKANTLWGWASPNEDITVYAFDNKYTTKADPKGNWQVTLPSKPYSSTTFSIKITGQNTVEITGIVLGDVWLCGGQSNMEWKFLYLDNRYDSIINTPYAGLIRYIDVENIASDTILRDITSKGWIIATPQSIPDMSAVAYFFGKYVNIQTNIPIGLISSNWGGTAAELWMSAEALKSFPDISREYLIRNEKNNKSVQKMKKRQSELIYKWTKQADSADAGLRYGAEWYLPATNTDSWQTITIPGIWEQQGYQNFDGIAWLNKTFILTDTNIAKPNFYATSIDDNDIVWLNGMKIGSSTGYSIQRNYAIPKELLKKQNVLTIKITDHTGNGGIPSKILLRSDTSTLLSLHGEYKIIKGFDITTLPDYYPPNWSNMNPLMPSQLYNAMIAPIQKFSIKGTIWYQGEGNADRAYQYRTLFPALIQDWRKAWQLPNMPFIYVQLANFLAPDTTPKDDPWPELREAQSMTLTVPNTAMAVAIDIGDARDIHPKNKKDVGERLAKCAMKIAYGYASTVYSGPTYKSMKVEGNKIRIYFANTGSGLIAKGGVLKEFAIAGADKKYYYANAKIEGNSVVVQSPKVLLPISVRYAWANNPANANLYNKEGLPASPFRTDTYPGVTINNIAVE